MNISDIFRCNVQMLKRINDLTTNGFEVETGTPLKITDKALRNQNPDIGKYVMTR